MTIGFDAVGIAPATMPAADEARYIDWLSAGCNADMGYMERRLAPVDLLVGCSSVIVCLLNYYPAIRQPEGEPKIARYAFPTDYHYIMWAKLYELAEKLRLEPCFVTCDTAPLLERALAREAGLGWIGRNNMLINRRFGSFTFLGTILTREQIEPDSPATSRCGNCSRCIDACPVGALSDHRLDARRCLSYRTIEARVPLTPAEAAHNRCFGCDICQEVCPWNLRFAKPHNHPELTSSTLSIDIANASNSLLRRARSPLCRSSLTKLKTNYMLCKSHHQSS